MQKGGGASISSMNFLTFQNQSKNYEAPPSAFVSTFSALLVELALDNRLSVESLLLSLSASESCRAILALGSSLLISPSSIDWFEVFLRIRSFFLGHEKGVENFAWV